MHDLTTLIILNERRAAEMIAEARAARATLGVPVEGPSRVSRTARPVGPITREAKHAAALEEIASEARREYAAAKAATAAAE